MNREQLDLLYRLMIIGIPVWLATAFALLLILVLVQP